MGGVERYRAAQRTRAVTIVALVFTVILALLVPPSYPKPEMPALEKALSLITVPCLGLAVLFAFIAAVTSPGLHPRMVRVLVVSALVFLNAAAAVAGHYGVQGAAASVTVLPSCALVVVLYVVSWPSMRRD